MVICHDNIFSLAIIVCILDHIITLSQTHSFPLLHTCHKLWTEICEIRQIFKGDLIKFCEIKIILKLYQNSQNPLFKCKRLVIDTKSVIYVYFFINSAVRWSENSVRFEKSYGNWLPDGPFEIWHVCFCYTETAGALPNMNINTFTAKPLKKSISQCKHVLFIYLFYYLSKNYFQRFLQIRYH